jgi:phosphatidylserine/phosphatidylglycerophosphate/cardiolipin synthase-like enzyme
VAHADIPVWIDHPPGIAHNKVIVIDRHLVVGGSMNYTKSATDRNAENVTFIESVEAAGWFLANWNARRAVSSSYTQETEAERAARETRRLKRRADRPVQ